MSKNSGKRTVRVLALAGSFAEDKDIARCIRTEHVMPTLKAGNHIVLDFSGVAVATQSFVHAMISEALRLHGKRALELIQFKSCNPTVKSVILTVVEYSHEAQKT